MSDTLWTKCPSEGRDPIKLPNYRAACPVCDFTYSTMMDHPLLPPHWRAANGDVMIAMNLDDAE